VNTGMWFAEFGPVTCVILLLGGRRNIIDICLEVRIVILSDIKYALYYPSLYVSSYKMK